MSASPDDQDSALLSPVLQGAAGWLIERRTWVLSVVLFLAIGSVAWTALRLSFKTSRLDLLNPDSEFNRLWIEYLEEFEAEDDAVAVVEGDSEGEITPVLDELAALASREPDRFRDVLHRIDLTQLQSKGLHYLSRKRLLSLRQWLAIWTARNGEEPRRDLAMVLLQQAEHAASAGGDSAEAVAAGEQVERTLVSLDAFLTDATYVSPWPQPDMPAALTQRQRYFTARTRDGAAIGFVLLRLDPGSGRFDQGAESIATLREIIAEVQSRRPNVRIGLTGLPVLEHDEMRTSQQDMIAAGLGSLIAVAGIFIAGFGSWRRPLLAVLVLLLGLALSFGYITVAVGHLNILSVSFAVVLIGLGIDFGIHFLARYQQMLSEGVDRETALTATAGSIGPGVVTGGVTTALAFFTAGLTEFTGVSELGVIAGGGLLICLAATIAALPPAVRMFDHADADVAAPASLGLADWVNPLFRWPLATSGVGLAAALLCLWGVTRLEYDHNLLNLQPDGLESVELEQRLIEDADLSVWYAVSVADSPEEVARKKAAFEALDGVARVEEIASLQPENVPAKQPDIRWIHDAVHHRQPATLLLSPATLLGAIERLEHGGFANTGARRAQLARLRQLSQSPDFDRLLARYAAQVESDLVMRLVQLQQAAAVDPPNWDDLPGSLVRRYVSPSDRYLLKVYGRADLWNMEALETFVAGVKSVDPRATGQPLQTYYASRQMQRSYINAAVFAVIAVAAVLMIDFQSVRMSLLSMTPMALGMAQMFGLLGWLDIPLNPANMIVLPLILGIGLDDGVHVVHDFLRRRGPYQLSESTASGIILTSLTTMVGFGCLMFSSHRGLQGLGRVLTLGVACCLFTSIVVLPAILRWWSQGESVPEDGESGQEPPSADTTSTPESRRVPRRRAFEPAGTA